MTDQAALSKRHWSVRAGINSIRTSRLGLKPLRKWIVGAGASTRAAIAVAAGALSAVSQAPFNWPILCVTLAADGLADRRCAGATRTRGLGLRAHRLVLRVRVFRRRPLLDGLRIPGGRGDVCLVAPDRGDRIAGMSGDFHGARFCGRATSMDAWSCTHSRIRGCAHGRRMAARARAHRLSLECLRLCAHAARRACTGCLADRDLGAHLHRACRIRKSGNAHRRAPGYETALAAEHLRARCSRGDVCARDRSDCHARRRTWWLGSRFGSCSRTCNRTASSIIRPRRR